mgnify:CR=1 FL=1
MKYTAPAAEKVSVEMINILLSSTCSADNVPCPGEDTPMICDFD